MTNNLPKIYIGGDHASFYERERLQKHLFSLGFEVVSEGSDNDLPTNYAVYAIKVGNRVQEHPGSLGIVLCGSGIGVNIAANKVKGIKSALVYSEAMAKLAKKRHYNVLALGTRFTSYSKLEKLVDTFLNVDKIDLNSIPTQYLDRQYISYSKSPYQSTNNTSNIQYSNLDNSVENSSKSETNKIDEALDNWLKVDVEK